jgi:hypothetical protein
MSTKEKESIQLLQRTLDLIVLRTLAMMGPQQALGEETQTWRRMAALVQRLLLEDS